MAYNKRPDARMMKALYGDLLDNLDNAEEYEEVPIGFGNEFKNTENYKLQVIKVYQFLCSSVVSIFQNNAKML